jgi:hypothetical protein
MRRRATMPRCRLQVEVLECRTLPSTYYAATASNLIADIKAANTGGANTIILTAPTTSPYVLTAVNNSTDGPTGLPVISKKDSLTIVGNGDTIERSTASGTPGFRLFDVASGSSLTLENLTLQNGEAGEAKATGNSAEGGAIFNQGTLVLSAVTVQSNTAAGPGAYPAGGGIWSNGSLTLENSSLIAGNSANAVGDGGFATNAYGGGIYIAAGTATITGTTFVSNVAEADGNVTFQGIGGSAYGGAIYVAGGTVTMSADTLGGTSSLDMNSAKAGPGGTDGPYGNAYGGGLHVAAGTVTLTNSYVIGNYVDGNNSGGALYGGGIFIASAATVYLDSFTYNNTVNNIDYSYLYQVSISDNIGGVIILL